jgi:hypothetical protein
MASTAAAPCPAETTAFRPPTRSSSATGCQLLGPTRGLWIRTRPGVPPETEHPEGAEAEAERDGPGPVQMVKGRAPTAPDRPPIRDDRLAPRPAQGDHSLNKVRRDLPRQRRWAEPDDAACVRGDQLLAEPASCCGVGPYHLALGAAARGVVDDLQSLERPAALVVVGEGDAAQCLAHDVPPGWAGESPRRWM